MYELERTSGIKIPYDYPNIENVKNFLTRLIYNFQTNESKEISFFEECYDHILIPRYYPIEGSIINNNTCDGTDIEINSKIIPRSEDQADVIKLMSTKNCGIIKRSTGSGKTILSIAAICNRKKKSIILCQNSEVLKNWKKEFLEFTDISEDQIDILKSSNKGYKQIFEKSIVLATPKLISFGVKKEKFLHELRNAGFGILIIDEVHKAIGPEIYTKSSIYINCSVTWALSATPKRKDNNFDILNFHFGDLYEFESAKHETMEPEIYQILFDHETFSSHKKYIMWGGKFSFQKYNQQLKNSKVYMDRVIHDIDRAFKAGRNILAISSRIDIIIEIVKRLKYDKSSIGLAIPTLDKKEKLKYSDTDDVKVAYHDKQLVFGTYSGVKEGLNRKSLDVIIFLTSSPDVEQAVGRVTRSLEGKSTPKVIDYVDIDKNIFRTWKSKPYEKPIFILQSEKRLEFYLSKGWKVNRIKLDKKENK